MISKTTPTKTFVLNKEFIILIGVLSLVLFGMNAQSFAEKSGISSDAWPTFVHPAYKFQFNYPPNYQVLGVNRWGCWIVKNGESINTAEDIQVRVEGFSLCQNPMTSACGFKPKADHLAVTVCNSWKISSSSHCKIKNVLAFTTISSLKGNKYQFKLVPNDLSKEIPFFYVVDKTIGKNGGLLYIIGGQNNLKTNEDLISRIIQSVTQLTADSR